MNSETLIIAIDGPSASGKGTIARKLAAHFGYAYLDTGLLYRAVGMAVLRVGGDLADADLAAEAARALAAGMNIEGIAPEGAPPSPGSSPGQALTLPARGREQAALAAIDFAQLMQDETLRSDQAGTAASKVAAVPAVREALLKFQKDFCASPPNGARGAVLDGRDIGTVIAPDAKVKIFVTASAEARAERRFKELQGRGLTTTYAEVLADMQSRDARDAERAIAPTKPALDAIVLDTTDLTAAQALEEAIKICSKR